MFSRFRTISGYVLNMLYSYDYNKLIRGSNEDNLNEGLASSVSEYAHTVRYRCQRRTIMERVALLLHHVNAVLNYGSGKPVT